MMFWLIYLFMQLYSGFEVPPVPFIQLESITTKIIILFNAITLELCGTVATTSERASKIHVNIAQIAHLIEITHGKGRFCMRWSMATVLKKLLYSVPRNGKWYAGYSELLIFIEYYQEKLDMLSSMINTNHYYTFLFHATSLACWLMSDAHNILFFLPFRASSTIIINLFNIRCAFNLGRGRGCGCIGKWQTMKSWFVNFDRSASKTHSTDDDVTFFSTWNVSFLFFSSPFLSLSTKIKYEKRTESRWTQYVEPKGFNIKYTKRGDSNFEQTKILCSFFISLLLHLNVCVDK